MSAAAERQRAAPLEPDRLEGFSPPREVERVFGHDAAIDEFEDALRSGRMHHAWLLVGPEGIGKATLAYRFARTVLGQGDRVGEAEAVFRKVAALSHPNLLLLHRAYNEKTKRYGQWIGVDEVRRLRAFLGNTAGESGWRVVIVDRADELNTNAANALLKALEEPPARTLFLLICGAEGRLPVTIRSRTRTLRVSTLDEGNLEKAVRAALARDGLEADAKTLGTALAERGFTLVSGGTDCHLLLVDLRSKGITGKVAQQVLDGVGIHTNKNTIPGDPESPFVTSGMRLGTAALTTRGMAEPEMRRVAELIDTAITGRGNDEALRRVRDDVHELTANYPLTALAMSAAG